MTLVVDEKNAVKAGFVWIFFFSFLCSFFFLSSSSGYSNTRTGTTDNSHTHSHKSSLRLSFMEKARKFELERTYVL